MSKSLSNSTVANFAARCSTPHHVAQDHQIGEMRTRSLRTFKPSLVRTLVAALLVLTIFSSLAGAQQGNTAAAVPQIIQFNGQFSGTPSDASAAVPAGTVSITFTLYENEQGGTALWSETQNIQVDAQGHYAALLGSASPQGLPLNLFTTGQAHWLAVQPLVSAFAEQPRVLLVSAPYALKAGDAETIGGLPPSAFVLAPPSASSGSGTTSTSSSSGTGSPGSPGGPTGQPLKPPLSGTGTTNFVPLWTSSTNLGNSKLFQTGGLVGVGTTQPFFELDVAGHINTSLGYNIQSWPVVATPGSGGITQNFNIALGYQALNSVTSGGSDTASGAQALFSNTSGTFNTANGVDSLYSNTQGSYNTATGQGALYGNLVGNFNTATGYLALGLNTASDNTADGYEALYSNTTGTYNVATGHNTLYSNTTGSYNTAEGVGALYSNAGANDNTASGYHALYSNSAGTDNTASGFKALANNTAGYNTASGSQALYTNTTGAFNTASGYQALYTNNGSDNTAVGYVALNANTTGNDNTASGYSALSSNIGGSYNTASGDQALRGNTSGGNNTASGYSALSSNSSGSNNIGIGYFAGLNVAGGNSNNIEIGSQGVGTDSGAIRIGTPGTQTAFFAAGVSGVNVSGVPVLVTSSGQLGVASSSRSFKEDILDMGDASHDLMRLRPVTFRYKQAFDDGSKPIQYGLIAEEVAEVYPDLVARSADGQIETVKYQLLDPMLLNEVQRQQTEIADQKALVVEQQSGLKAQQALVLEQQNQLKSQQAEIRELASQVRTIQASLRSRHKPARPALASAQARPAARERDVASPASGGK
jgi:trimeric autotransporter adhesin